MNAPIRTRQRAARHRRTAAVALLLSGAACGPPDEAPESTADSAPAADRGADPQAAAQTLECVNTVDGYTVRYPVAWHVNPTSRFHPCTFFDSEPLDIPVDSEVPLEIAVVVGLESTEFAAATVEAIGRRDLARERITIDGRPAMRIEGETTGEGLYDRGIRSYQYFIDLGERTMIASTYDAGPVPFDRKREALDAMMRSLQLREPE